MNTTMTKPAHYMTTRNEKDCVVPHPGGPFIRYDELMVLLNEAKTEKQTLAQVIKALS